MSLPVRTTPEAEAQILTRFGNTSRKDDIDAADRVLADIYDTLRTLAAFPHIGHRRP